MELRYCEKCGDVIRVETDEPLNPTVRFLCGRCQGEDAAASPRAEPAKTPAQAERPLDPSNLNLFSPQTIAVKKKELEELESKMASEPQTPANLRVVKRPSSAVARGGGGPAPKGQKILFRCLHCRSTLSIRPVSETSKLTCPHCAKTLYVTPGGKLLAAPPSSVVARTTSRRPETARPGSARAPAGAARPPSAGVRTASGSVRTGSAAKRTGAAAPAAPKPPSVGLRSTAHPEDDGSKRADPVRPGSARAPAGRPASAFEEHLSKGDPAKTAFLTEETTRNLNELAADGTIDRLASSGPVLANPGLADSDLAAEADAIDPGALLADPSELLEENLFPSSEPEAPSKPAEAPRAAPARSRPASRLGTAVGTLAGGILLVAVLVGPFSLAQTFSARGAFAAARDSGRESWTTSGAFAKVVRTVARGLRDLVVAPGARP